LLTRIAPLFRPIIGSPGVVLWATLCVAALVLAGTHWSALVDNLPDKVFSLENLGAYVAVYVAIKLVHELAHGVVAKHYGATIHEVGIMFLVLFPVPYVDGWATTSFRNKWHRASVAMAGIFAETAIAAIAMFVWVASEPGMLRGVAYNTMLVAGFSTVFINANPLLKFDGYFALCDAIESPNLGQRANEYWGRLTEQFAFGLEQEEPAKLGRGEAWIALLYAPAAFVYRIFLSVTIALMVASQYLFLGAVLALWSLTMSLLYPAGKALWKVFAGPRLQRKRARAVTITTGALAIGAIALLAVPFPSQTVVRGHVWLPETAAVKAGSEGFVNAMGVTDGAKVSRFDAIMNLEDPVLDARFDVYSAALREAELKRESYRGLDPVLFQTAATEVSDAQERVALAQLRLEGLELRAAGAGTFRYAVSVQDLPARHMSRGDVVGWVLPEALSVVRVVVPQRYIERIRENTVSVSVMSAATNAGPQSGRILQMAEGGTFALPDPVFGSAAGGEIPTDPSDPNGLRALERVFIMDVSFDAVDAASSLMPGAGVYVRFSHDPTPVGRQLGSYLRYLVFRDLDI